MSGGRLRIEEGNEKRKEGKKKGEREREKKKNIAEVRKRESQEAN